MSKRDEHYFIYVKDSNGKHTGITICVMQKDGKIWHGQATCSKNDQFEKSVGRQLSYERAVADYEKNKVNKEPIDEYKTDKSIWVETSGDNNSLFYNVEKKEKKYDKTITMTTNKQLDDRWWKDNAFIGEIHDDGNGISVTLGGGTRERNGATVIRFDYSQWEDLNHLFKLSYVGSHFKESKFYQLQQDRTIP